MKRSQPYKLSHWNIILRPSSGQNLRILTIPNLGQQSYINPAGEHSTGLSTVENYLHDLIQLKILIMT